MQHANDTAKHGTPALAHSACPLWHVAFAINDVRTMTIEELDQAYQSGAVHSRTIVWTEGMGDWAPLGEVAALDDEECESPPQAGRPGSSLASGASVAHAPTRANPAGTNGRSMAPVALSIQSGGAGATKPALSAWGGWVLAAAGVVAGAGGWVLTGESRSAPRRSPVSEAPPPPGAASQPPPASVALKAPGVPKASGGERAVAVAALRPAGAPPKGEGRAMAASSGTVSASGSAAEPRAKGLSQVGSEVRASAGVAAKPVARKSGASPTVGEGSAAEAEPKAGAGSSAEEQPVAARARARAAARKQKRALRAKRRAERRKRRRREQRLSARRASAPTAEAADSAFDPLNGALP